jgi:1-phosphofructokinase
MISLGSKGAVLACSDGCFSATAPRINAISTIGAGDSSIAGFLAATQKGLPAKDILKTAVSYGSAACLTEGTKPPRKDDIEALLKKTIAKQIRITRIEL